MAEIIAGASAAASIGQLVVFGKQIYDRLDEYRETMNGFPETFKHVTNRLGVLVEVLDSIERDINSGAMSDSSQRAIFPSVQECGAQIDYLQKIIEKALPPQGATRMKRSLKALGSLKYDAKIDKTSKIIDQYMETLDRHHNMCRNAVNSGPAGSRFFFFLAFGLFC